MGTEKGDAALLSVEAEAYCQSLTTFKLDEIGSPSWSRQHEKIEKLNMQAIMNASAQENEFIKEFLVNEEKFPVLVHELICTEIWKKYIFQELINMDFQPKMTFPTYVVLYHEATVANLLETTLFYQEACVACGDATLDIADYCHRKLVWLTSRQEGTDEMSTDKNAEEAHMQELSHQRDTLEFDIAMKTISIVRYITDHMHDCPLSTATRLLNTHDLPVLLVELIQSPPWTRQSSNGQLQKYIDGKWKDVADRDRFKITQTEGQVWIALFRLLMDAECQKKYELNNARKNTILKARAHLNEIMLDQLPILAEMQVYLEHLSMMEPPPAKRDLVLEQVPEIWDSIIKGNKGRWKKIAQLQKKYLDPKESILREQAQRWTETYNFENLQSLLPEAPKCAKCGEPATKRCSRCQNDWYCRRECQVKAWKEHKPVCDLLAEANKTS